MRIAIVLTPPTDQYFRWASQSGVSDFVARYQFANSYDKLVETCERSASFGLQTAVVEGYLPIASIIHRRAGYETQLEEMKILIRNMGKLGVGVLCYNWMPDNDWTRNKIRIPARGGAITNGFDESLLDPLPLEIRHTGSEQLWENLESFLKELLPVAEDANVKLAAHPDDPPLPTLRSAPQIMYQSASFDRLLEISDSPSNTMCFCQGTFAEMGVDIPGTIRHFGPKISYVHFRDVEGTASNFIETFHDNGQTDMFAAMRAYSEVGFSGSMRPDHVPALDGEGEESDGYSMLGRLFAVGYMRGLMHAVEGLS